MKVWWTNSGTVDKSAAYEGGGEHIDVTYDHRPRRVTLRPRAPIWTRRLNLSAYRDRQLPDYPMIALSIGPIGLPIDVSQDLARRMRFVLRRTWYDGSIMEGDRLFLTIRCWWAQWQRSRAARQYAAQRQRLASNVTESDYDDRED